MIWLFGYLYGSIALCLLLVLAYDLARLMRPTATWTAFVNFDSRAIAELEEAMALIKRAEIEKKPASLAVREFLRALDAAIPTHPQEGDDGRG